MNQLFWLLLPLAAASGWWAARRSWSAQNSGAGRDPDYFTGLNYLIADQADQAIDVFTRLADVDRDTAEIHLALGNLFRRRGEVDRAIYIHSGLINRNQLTAAQRWRAMLELGEDYLRAGLFDRAEELFQQLLEQPDYTVLALARLIHIFQQEKDWRKAIAHADRFERISSESTRQQTAHFCCELAEEASAREQEAEAQTWLHDALQRDPDCARANLLLGRAAMRGADYRAAIQALQAVERQDRGYFPEVIEPLGACYTALNQPAAWIAYLREVQARDHGGRITDALAEWLLRQEGEEAALHFLEEELRQHPTLLGMRRLVSIKLARGQGASHADLRALHQISSQMLQGAARYRCEHCGFTVKALHWCCPSCLRWGTIKPLPDLALTSPAL